MSVIGPVVPLTAISDGYGDALPEPGIVIWFGLVNNVAAEVDAVTASVATTQRTATRISLRTMGKRPALRGSPPTLSTHLVLAKIVSIIRALLFPGWLS